MDIRNVTAGARDRRRAALARDYLSLGDFDAAARRHLPRMLYGYIAGASETGSSLRANAAGFEELFFVPRVLTGPADRDVSTQLFGRRYAAPFGISPMGAAGICAYRADVALAGGAAAAGIPMILSASSLIALEEVARVAPDIWYQAYLAGDPGQIDQTIDRVAAAGIETFVLTADCAVPANRENNTRNGFGIPLRPSLRLLTDGVTHPGWLAGTFLRTYLGHGAPHFENLGATRGPALLSRAAVGAMRQRDRLSWEHVALIRRRWKGRLVVKGVLSPEDARRAADCGADGVIVSNHGGRQLDGAVSAMRILPAVRAAAGDLAVMIDGGFRRGTDVLKALALGADFVFAGRPFLFAAAVAGEAGVRRAASILAEEIDRDMALLGIRTLGELDAGYLVRPPRS